MATLIAIGTPAEGQDEALGRYLQGVLPLLLGAGGTPVKRLRVANTVVGSGGFAQVLVMDFGSAEAITDVFASDEYKALIADRDRAFPNLEMLITEDIG